MAFAGIGILISLFALSLLLGSLVGLGVLWWRVLRRPVGAATGASCGQCGAGVRGIGSMNCPECGGDLREVGIVTPKRRGVISPAMFLIAWSICLPLPAMVISGIVIGFGPKEQTISRDVRLSPGSSSGKTVRVSITASRAIQGGAGAAAVSTGTSSSTSHHGSGSFTFRPGLPNRAKLQSVTIQVTHNNTAPSTTTATQPNVPTTLRLDTAGRRLDNGKAPTVREIESMLFPTKAISPAQTKQAQELLGAVQDITAGKTNLKFQHFTSSGSGSSTYSGPVAWFGFTVLGFWSVLYALGIVLFLRIRKRRQAEAQRASDASLGGTFAPPQSESVQQPHADY